MNDRSEVLQLSNKTTWAHRDLGFANGFYRQSARRPSDILLSEGSRRLAAIMFTDMVGYTALTQANEPHALEILAQHQRLVRPILPKFHGREVKTIGDSFLIEFDSAVEATNCAVEIQRFLHDYNISSEDPWKVRLRIGIHLGDIVHVSGDVLGDAVNIASRIEPLAEAEGVCVTGQVYEQVRNRISRPLSKLPARDLKNVEFPVDVYRIIMPWEETQSHRETREKPPILRIAVLPFTNMSPDPNDEYFADGMTEELIDRLAQVRELRVIARTSVMGYKKSEKKASEIAKELDVGTLVEGSVRKAGNKIRITVQLIDADTEEHLWSTRYDKNLDDVFAIQTEISEKVAEQAKVRLVDSEKHMLEKKPTQNTEAYTLYLKGRYYWNERTRPSVEKGIEYLKKAIEKDPSLALAYSDLADAYVMTADYAMLPPTEAYARIKQSARKALEMDPGLSQPHAALATVHERNYEWEDADREFKQAIAANPNNVIACHWYALHQFFTGRRDQAIQDWKRAKELDPLSLVIGSSLGYALVRMGHTSEGLEILETVLEINDEFVVGHRNLSYAYILAGMKNEAAEEAKKLLALSRETVNVTAAAAVYALAGFRAGAESILKSVLENIPAEYTDPAHIAGVYAAMGDENKALDWMERAVDERSGGVVYLHVFPTFDLLEKNPRFKALVKRIGLDSNMPIDR